MGGQTDYLLLGIVATVAIIAVFTMQDLATEPAQAELPEYVPPDSSYVARSVQGAVVQDGVRISQAIAGGYSIEGRWDLDDDGALTRTDAELLSAAIGAGRCEALHDCDLNNDGAITLDDLGLLNAEILRRQGAHAAASTAPDRVVPVRTASATSRGAAAQAAWEEQKMEYAATLA